MTKTIEDYVLNDQIEGVIKIEGRKQKQETAQDIQQIQT